MQNQFGLDMTRGECSALPRAVTRSCYARGLNACTPSTHDDRLPVRRGLLGPQGARRRLAPRVPGATCGRARELHSSGLIPRMTRVRRARGDARRARDDPRRRYLDRLERELAESPATWTLDTYFNEATQKAAWRAAGGAVELAARVARGQLDAGLALVRPPGHHATRDRRHGLLLAQQRRDRRSCAADRRARQARSHPRLGRPPRQRYREHLLGRSGRAVRVDPPIPLLPGHRPGHGHGRSAASGTTIKRAAACRVGRRRLPRRSSIA